VRDGIEKRKSLSVDCPRRTTGPGAGIVVGTGLLFLIVQFLPDPRFWHVLPALCLFLAAILSRDVPAVLFTLFTVSFVIVPLLHPALRGWPFHLLVATGCSLLLALFLPHLRPTLSWLRPGRLGRPVLFGVVATSALSATALYLWSRMANPDLTVHLAHIPSLPVWLIPLAGLAFACGNAALEELAFRGIVMQAFENALSRAWVAVACQAVLFGAMHYRQGFPNEGWGLAMTFVYGVMLGALRRQSKGMLAPWLAHVSADTVIFLILVAQR
jgi:membrane protease YdiL (CAAX protease family)